MGYTHTVANKRRRDRTQKPGLAWGYGYRTQDSRAPPLAVLCSFPSYSTSVSLWEMDLEELEILLRKQTHSEEEHARIIGSCSLTCLSVEDLNQLL